LGEALEELRRTGIKLAVVDTPPAITDSISQVVAHADLVVIPTRPSPHDLRSVGATVDIAERHGKPLVFVMNGATARARITGETAIALSQHGTVAPITLHHRVDFAASMVDGRSVGEVMPKSQSAKEIRDLWTYLQDRLSRLTHDTKLIPDVRPEHFSIEALTALTEETVVAEPEAETATESAVEPDPVTEPVPARERRVMGERRTSFAKFNGVERRSHPFGRRAQDRN
jgi:chromosome partitioning protein